LGLATICAANEAELLETLGPRPDGWPTLLPPPWESSAKAVTRRRPSGRERLPPREEPTMERVAIIARPKEGNEQRAAELVGAGPSFDLADGQPRVARQRFGWQLDDAEPIATPAGERSESWA
jgi:hypothetical protein